MHNASEKYRRLSGKKKNFLIGYHTLWQGPDHLLHIFSKFGIEDYKRFYFNDIQAIITRKTIAGRIQNFILAGLLGFFVLLAFFSDNEWLGFPAVMIALLLILLLINWFRGPTCETYLLTAIQTEKLHSLHRLKNTQKVMSHVRPLIEQTQGILPTETVDQNSLRFPKNPRSLKSSSHVRPPKSARKHEMGRAHMIMFALLVLNGLIITLGLLLSHIALTLLSSIVSMLTGICVIIALVRQHESDMIRSIRTMTWTTLSYVCFLFVAGYIISMAMALRNPQLIANQWELLKMISEISPWENPLLLGFNIFSLCSALIIGVLGLFLLKKYRKEHQKSPTVLTTTVCHPASARIP
ncbi:MAG: hypothetical protein JSV31_25770 [Desulfobacterales bacterium]|nr:MAG: hypothetical protein JSV31_25770 [Desulfobacterales bacterium]